MILDVDYIDNEALEKLRSVLQNKAQRNESPKEFMPKALIES